MCCPCLILSSYSSRNCPCVKAQWPCQDCDPRRKRCLNQTNQHNQKNCIANYQADSMTAKKFCNYLGLDPRPTIPLLPPLPGSEDDESEGSPGEQKSTSSLSRVYLRTRASNARADATAPDNNVNTSTAQGRRDNSADVDPSQSPTEPNANPHPRGPAEGADQAQADTGWGGILNVGQADASQGGNMRGRATRNRAGLRESFGLPTGTCLA